MRKRHMSLAFAGAFLISLFLCTFIIQALTGALTETRRSVLISALSSTQVAGVGGFHYFYNISNFDYVTAPGTAGVLLALNILGALDHVDLDAALRFISSEQDLKEGGYDVIYGYDGTPLGDDLGTSYQVVTALKALNALDRINRTLLVDFVLERYNSSSGAFHELVTMAYGRAFAECAFGIEFRNFLGEVAYAADNVISTFLAVSILKDVDALNLINVTKTLEWVMSDQSTNGGFKPYPHAEPEFLPGWSSLIQNPFDVDRDGAGIPYTYAATGVLKALGFTYLLDKEKVRDYILSCQFEDGRFTIHKDYTFDRMFCYTYYAIVALGNIDMLNETSEAVSKVKNIVLRDQLLVLDNSWPVPMPQSEYGLFMDDGDPLGGTPIAIEILNATGGLSLLSQPTPRVIPSLLNATLVSMLTSGLLLFILIIISKAKRATAPKRATST